MNYGGKAAWMRKSYKGTKCIKKEVGGGSVTIKKGEERKSDEWSG